MITILQEVTDWEWPNHTYHVNSKGKLVGYIKQGTQELIPVPGFNFSKSHRKFKTLGTIDDDIPAGAKIVEGSNGNKYIVHDGKCTCTGFKYHGKCKHVHGS